MSLLSVWPQILIHLIPDILPGNTAGEESSGVLYPSPAVMSSHVAIVALSNWSQGL